MLRMVAPIAMANINDSRVVRADTGGCKHFGVRYSRGKHHVMMEGSDV